MVTFAESARQQLDTSMINIDPPGKDDDDDEEVAMDSNVIENVLQQPEQTVTVTEQEETLYYDPGEGVPQSSSTVFYAQPPTPVQPLPMTFKEELAQAPPTFAAQMYQHPTTVASSLSQDGVYGMPAQ